MNIDFDDLLDKYSRLRLIHKDSFILRDLLGLSDDQIQILEEFWENDLRNNY